MKVSLARGSVSISIDVETIAQPAASSSKTGDAQTIELLNRFNDAAIPATWAFTDPASAKAAAEVASSTVGHEISLLADSSRVANSAHPRKQFKQAVIRPIQLAAEKKRRVSTLSTRQPWMPQCIDLLTKYGVTVVRSPQISADGCNVGGVESICFGLVHVFAHATVAGGGWISNRSQSGAAIRAINEAAATGGVCHVRIDMAAIGKWDSASAWQSVDRLLEHVGDLKSGGRIQIETLQQMAARLQRKRSGVPARSILRAA